MVAGVFLYVLSYNVKLNYEYRVLIRFHIWQVPRQ